LLACALADRDALSYFRSADVAAPLALIMGDDDAPSFSRHLKEFCTAERGPVLERVGARQPYRYRFTNPVLEPYVIMQGLADKLISEDDLAALRT
jgi:surfactin synthase thioesterase subunit